MSIDKKTEELFKGILDRTYDQAIGHAVKVVEKIYNVHVHEDTEDYSRQSLITKIISELSKLKSNDHANNNNEG